MGFIVLLVVLALLVFWLIGAYNKLIGLKNQVANAWKQIDVQLKRRHDLIPNLVAGMAGASPAELWEITDVAERAVPNVDLSFGSPPPRTTA